MFFSLDLLSIRGGKMNTIWLLGTLKEKETVIKRKKGELLKNDLKAICRELVAKFPVQGKEASLSLRMSSHLVYGVCVNLRVQAEELRRATLRLLSVKAVPRHQAIDLPTATSAQVTREGEPRQEDLDLGQVDLHASHQLTDLAAFLVRGADPDITMVELPTGVLDFQGLELPMLSRAEMLEQDWDLENSARGQVGDLLPAGEEPTKRGREGEDEATSSKRARTEVEEPAEVTVMGLPEEQVAEAPGRRTGRPEILVTPAVEEEARRLTPPTQLDMVEAVEEPGLVDQARVEVPVAEVALVEEPVAEVPLVEEQPVEVPEAQPAGGFLQPLVPAGVRRPRARRAGRLVVDEALQLPARDIRASLQDGWRRSVRCEHAVQDLVTRDQPRPVSMEGLGELGELLGAQARELLRRAATRARVWDWEDEAVQPVVEEQVEVQQEQELEVPEQGGNPEELLEESRRRESREGSVAGDSREATLLKNSVQADESAGVFQADLSFQADALGGDGGAQLAPPEVQDGLDVTPVADVTPVVEEVAREEPEVNVTEDTVLATIDEILEAKDVCSFEDLCPTRSLGGLDVKLLTLLSV